MLPFEPVCGECQDGKWFRTDYPVEHPDFGKLIPCSWCNTVTAEQRLRRSGLTAKEQRQTLDAFDPNRDPAKRAELTKNLATARAYAEGRLRTPFLVLQGSKGTGKSHLAAGITLDRIYHPEHGPSGRFWYVIDMLDTLRASMGDEDKRYELLIEGISTMPFLVLDDLGQQSDTAWANERVKQIVNARYRKELSTVITTNKNLLAAFDEALASRIFAENEGFTTVLTFTAKDQRLKP